MDDIYSSKNLNSFEKLTIVFLVSSGYISDSSYSYLPKNSQIAKKLNADPSAVSRALKRLRELNILVYNNDDQVKLNREVGEI